MITMLSRVHMYIWIFLKYLKNKDFENATEKHTALVENIEAWN